MSRRQHLGFGKQIADAVRAEIDSRPSESASAGWNRSWLSEWADATPARDRSRRWLTWGLQGALQDIPDDQVLRYLEEMGEDIKRLGADEAISRFIDNILPRLISNKATG